MRGDWADHPLESDVLQADGSGLSVSINGNPVSGCMESEVLEIRGVKSDAEHTAK